MEASKVFEALGQASMCWSETPKGVFDDKEAVKVGEDLMKSIEESQMRFAEWCSGNDWQFIKDDNNWIRFDFETEDYDAKSTSELLEIFNKRFKK